MLIGLQLLVLLIRTQMPQAWRVEGVQRLHAPSYVSSLAHAVLFAGMAMLVPMRPMSWLSVRILAVAMAGALLTEGFQFFAIDRQPRLIDVGIDMAGMVAGLVLSRLISAFSEPQ